MTESPHADRLSRPRERVGYGAPISPSPGAVPTLAVIGCGVVGSAVLEAPRNDRTVPVAQIVSSPRCSVLRAIGHATRLAARSRTV